MLADNVKRLKTSQGSSGTGSGAAPDTGVAPLAAPDTGAMPETDADSDSDATTDDMDVTPDTDTVAARDLHHKTVVWPSNTDIIFVPGTCKVMLSIQLPLLRSILLDAFDRVRISLLFIDAFPDALVALGVIRAGLVAAAASRLPTATDVHQRLVCDVDYMVKMIRLVSSSLSNRILLTLFTATCPHPPYSSGSERPLHGDHTRRLFGPWFATEDCSSRFKTAHRLQVHISHSGKSGKGSRQAHAAISERANHHSDARFIFRWWCQFSCTPVFQPLPDVSRTGWGAEA